VESISGYSRHRVGPTVHRDTNHDEGSYPKLRATVYVGGIEPLELTPLQEYVDSDALANLVAPAGPSSGVATTAAFGYEDQYIRPL